MLYLLSCGFVAEEGANMDEENLKTLVTPEKFSDILNLKDDSPDDHVLVWIINHGACLGY